MTKVLDNRPAWPSRKGDFAEEEQQTQLLLFWFGSE